MSDFILQMTKKNIQKAENKPFYLQNDFDNYIFNKLHHIENYLKYFAILYL